MNRNTISFTTVILLSLFLAYQMIDLITYLKTPHQITIENKLEIPEIINSQDIDLKAKKSKKNESQTRPLEKQKFLKVHNISSEDIRYSKEDYLVGEKKFVSSHQTGLNSDWEKKVLNSETVIERSLKQAASSQSNSHAGTLNLPTYQNGISDMERFAIKIELPSQNEGAKFKLQYREPPDFGKSNLPEPVNIRAQTNPNATFSIEKTKATDSPWDNFSNPLRPQ